MWRSNEMEAIASTAVTNNNPSLTSSSSSQGKPTTLLKPASTSNTSTSACTTSTNTTSKATAAGGPAPSPDQFTRNLSFALGADWPPPVMDSEALTRGFSEWSMSSLDAPAEGEDMNVDDQGLLLADLKAMLEKQNSQVRATSNNPTTPATGPTTTATTNAAEPPAPPATATLTQPLQGACSNIQGPAPAWASRGSSYNDPTKANQPSTWGPDIKPLVPGGSSWSMPAGALVTYSSDRALSDTESCNENLSLSSSGPPSTTHPKPTRKKKARSGERCGADIEKKRLKKNAREQRRATKINDQINILKNVLENTGVQVPNTKSSILSETISLLQTALKGQVHHVVPPPTYTPAEQLLLEPYYMLFRKSATPLAIAKADSTGQFLDCNNRFSEIFGFAAEQLADRTAYSITSQQDLELTSRLLNTVMVNPALDDGTGEVIFTTSEDERILVKVSALKDENRRPLYLLFTPRAVIRNPGPGEPIAAHATAR